MEVNFFVGIFGSLVEECMQEAVDCYPGNISGVSACATELVPGPDVFQGGFLLLLNV